MTAQLTIYNASFQEQYDELLHHNFSISQNFYCYCYLPCYNTFIDHVCFTDGHHKFCASSPIFIKLNSIRENSQSPHELIYNELICDNQLAFLENKILFECDNRNLSMFFPHVIKNGNISIPQPYNCVNSDNNLFHNSYSDCGVVTTYQQEFKTQDYNLMCNQYQSDQVSNFVNTNVNNNEGTLFLPGTTIGPVINLSNFQLTPAMISLLSKGLNFCPTPGEPDRYQLRRDLDKFHVSLRRKLFFDKRFTSAQDTQSTSSIELETLSDSDEQPFEHFQFSNRSTWSPKGSFQLESLISFNEAILNEYKFPAPSPSNLTYRERHALAELQKASNIIIKPADKGSAIVIQNIEDYITEGIRQLSDRNFYVETNDDLTFLHNDLITNLIEYLHTEKEISPKCRSYLLNDNPRTPQLYLLPKIHKNKNPVPGRPIVSANNSPTEKISQLADFFLQPLVQGTKSFVKDTTDFITKIEALPAVPENCLLCTIDVSSLYTNIPNDEGILACKKLLYKHRKYSCLPSNDNIAHLLEYVLYMNNFDFNGKHYLQVGGTAMGTKVAPSFANIFMADFENKWVYNYKPKPLIWLRYIDDIFMIWNEGQKSLQDFLTHLNSCHRTIKFTSEISEKEVNFLDTTVKIDEHRKLYTDLFCKPTDSHNYLLYESAHPGHLKSSLPYSQLLRIRRICTHLSDFDKNAVMIGKHFLRRNYPEDIVTQAIVKTRRMNREELLHPVSTPKSQKSEYELFLISEYNPDCSPLKSIVQQNWPALGRTANTESLYNKRVIFGNRRPKNLKDTLVHAKIPHPTPEASVISERKKKRKCIARGCRYCPKLDLSGQIKSKSTGRNYSTKTQITCNSNNLIYCISCKVCQKQYVGQTKNSIKERFKCHFYSVTHPEVSDTTIGRHFSATDHNGLNDITIHVLEFIHIPKDTPASQRFRDESERTWMHRLASISPLGLNSAD